MSFAAVDHVTEREPGKWEDCTFASMLETMRLGLPNGTDIPPTITEVNRFARAAGFPEGHQGATIEDTLPAASRLYGLTARHYSLTREWDVLEREFRDPDTVAVVTGVMAAVPAYLRRWSPRFTGAHAVAGRSNVNVPIWCDPLAPRDGTYDGEPVPMGTWWRFTNALPGWQALIMKAAQAAGGLMIAMGGVQYQSDKIIRVVRRTAILDAPAGNRIASAERGYRYAYIGADSGYRVVVVNTAIPYDDDVKRPTGCYLRGADVVIEDA